MAVSRVIGSRSGQDWWQERRLVEIGGRLWAQEYTVGSSGPERRSVLVESVGELPTWLEDDEIAAALAVLDGEVIVG